MLKKYLCIFLTLIMALSTTVGASNYTGYMEPITDPGIQPMDIRCTLFGHSDSYTFEYSTSNYRCVRVADDECAVACHRWYYCSRCGEFLQTDFIHIKYGICIREMADNGETYVCTLDHPKTN